MNRRALPVALLLSLASPLVAGPPAGEWTRAWTAALWEARPNQEVKLDGQTIRATVRVGAAGSAIRLRLGNDWGEAPVQLGTVRVSTASGRSAAVTFNGKTDAVIAAAAPIVSDPVQLPVKAFELVTVSIHLPEAVTLRGIHIDRGDQTLISAPGDFTAAASFTPAHTTPSRPLIEGLDVLAARARPVVVGYGDSITDNVGCANDAPTLCSWPDVLARRLADATMPHVVVNQAIGGNRISLPGGTGQSAQARFEMDVLSIPGVTHVVLLEGINDIRPAPKQGVTAQQLIDAYRQLIVRAHDHGIKVVGMTVLPFGGNRGYTPEANRIRMEINRWMLTSGEFDAVVDLDKVVGDPADPLKMRADFDPGDHLHPNPAGEIAMGEAIPLSLFRDGGSRR